MEISPKLTSASALNSTVITKPSQEAAAASELSKAAANNKGAADDIAKLSTDQKSASVAEANRESSRVDVKDVDNLAADLNSRIKESPEKSLSAVATSLTNDLVRTMLS